VSNPQENPPTTMTISQHQWLHSLPAFILSTAVPTVNGIANVDDAPNNETGKSSGGVRVRSGGVGDDHTWNMMVPLSDVHSRDDEKYIFRLPNRKRRRVKSSSEEKSIVYHYNEYHENVFERHGSSTSSSSKGCKSDKSTKESKSDKSSGKGNGKGGDNYVPVTHPTNPPAPSLPPTQPPGKMPTRLPTDTPASAIPTTDEIREPPSGINQNGRCSPDTAGLYGSQLGFAEVSQYSYQVTTIPSVTVEELNSFVLPNIEDAIVRGVLPQIFESCNTVTSSTNVNQNDDVTSPPTPTSLNGYVLVGDTYVYSHENKRGRQRARREMMMYEYRMMQSGSNTPPQQIEGVSTQPPDEVAEGVACVNQVVPNLNCFVIRGSITTYSREKQTEETQEYILNAIEITLMETTSELVNADNRILDVEFRDTDLHPIPEDPDDDDVVTDDITNGSGPTPSPVIRPDTSERSFEEPWQYALIAVASVLILAMIYLCMRRPRGRGFFLSSDDKDVSDKESGDEVEENGEMDPLAVGRTTFGADSTINERDRLSHSYRNSENALGTAREEQQEEDEREVVSHEEGDEEYAGDNDENYIDEQGYDEKEYERADESSMDEEMNDEGEWVEDNEFEDEPTYEERLNDEHSPTPGGNGVAATAAGLTAATVANPASSFDPSEQPEPSFVFHDGSSRSFEVASSEGPYSSLDPQGPASATSFSAAIARAMSQAKGEKSETEFSPFDAIHDDNIYGATTGDGKEYEFRNTMPMNSSHHDESSAASSEFEEIPVEEELEDDEYEIEYATESEEEMEEEFGSDEEDESYGS
jgi:hypothetical protein